MVIPFLVNAYVKRLISNLLKDLKTWNKSFITSAIAAINEGNSDIEKLFLLITLPEYDPNRRAIYAQLDDFPLLKYRIFSLSEQLKSRKEYRKMVETHEKKVRWHLQRIYRARNCIIHDGEEVRHVDNLVENLHTYVDIMCESMIDSMREENSEYTISDAIVEETFIYNKYCVAIESISDPSKDNYRFNLYHELV